MRISRDVLGSVLVGLSGGLKTLARLLITARGSSSSASSSSTSSVASRVKVSAVSLAQIVNILFECNLFVGDAFRYRMKCGHGRSLRVCASLVAWLSGCSRRSGDRGRREWPRVGRARVVLRPNVERLRRVGRALFTLNYFALIINQFNSFHIESSQMTRSKSPLWSTT